MAMRNAPTVQDAIRQEISERATSGTEKARADCRKAANALQSATCFVFSVPNALALGQHLSQFTGPANVPLTAYIIAACVMLWFWFVRPSGLSNEVMITRYARRVILGLAGFIILPSATLLSYLLIAELAEVHTEDFLPPLLLLPVLSLMVVSILSWRRKERALWWLITLATIPISLLIVAGLYGYVRLELESAFGLAHLVLLPAATAALGALLWWALAPFTDGRASRVGHLLFRLRGGRGRIDEDKATLRFINPLFVSLLVLTVAVIVVLVVVHPLHVTGRLRMHRAVLLPVILGMPVALFTYITHWSARVCAPLIFAVVFVIGAIGIWGDNHQVRTVANAPKRMMLKEAIGQWAAVNACTGDLANCPAPVIVAAAGGASRSAFHVAGVIGNLLDEQRFSPLRGHRHRVMAAPFSPDLEGGRIVTASLDRTAKIWDAGTGQLIHTLSYGQATRRASFSPDGRLVATADDYAARIWNAETGTLERTLEPHRGSVTSAEFSPNGDLVVTASADKLVRIWRVATGELIHELGGHDSAVNSAVFSRPIGTKLATGSDDKTIRIWDVGTGHDITPKPMRHDGAVRSVAFSPDGKRLVTASRDETARVWDATTGDQLHSLDGHYGLVNSADFSRDGTRIITASWDNTVRIWDATTFKDVKVMRAHARDINSAAFSPDGERIITASDDGTVRMWSARTYERYPWRVTAAHPFGNQLFAISAVSGGALGAVLTYAALADTQRDNLTGTGIGTPPCTKESLSDPDWFGAPVRGRQIQPANPVQSWRDCLQLLSAGDFLSPVFVSLLSNDPLRIGLRDNRAVVLEHAWEARYARLTGQKDGLGIMFKDDGATTLAQSLSTVRNKAAAQGTWLPILVLNGTSVETGRRIITSDVETVTRDGNGQVTGRVFSDAYDLHELFARSSAKQSGESKKALFGKANSFDIRLSTAGHHERALSTHISTRLHYRKGWHS